MILLKNAPVLIALVLSALCMALSLHRWKWLAFPGTLLAVLALWLTIMAGGSMHEGMICLVLPLVMLLSKRERNSASSGEEQKP